MLRLLEGRSREEKEGGGDRHDSDGSSCYQSLLWARGEAFLCLLFNFHYHSVWWVPYSFLISEMRELKVRKVESLVCSYTARNWKSQEPNQVCSTPTGGCLTMDSEGLLVYCPSAQELA